MTPLKFFIKIYRRRDKVFRVSDYDDVHHFEIHDDINRTVPFLIKDPLKVSSICYKYFQAHHMHDLVTWFGPEIRKIVQLDTCHRAEEVDKEMFSRKRIGETEKLHKILCINSFIRKRMDLRLDQRWKFSANRNGEAVLWTVDQWLEAARWLEENGHNSPHGPQAIKIFQNQFDEIHDFVRTSGVPYYTKKGTETDLFINWSKLSSRTKVLFKLSFSPRS